MHLASSSGALFGPPSPSLRASIVVPAKDEADCLPALVRALDRLALPAGWVAGSVEALVLLNNCSDGSAEALAPFADARPWLHVGCVDLAPAEAHVGRARQLLFDAAAARLADVGQPGGLVLSTDADSRPAPDWLAETVAETLRGADLVGGRIGLGSLERAALSPGVRRLYLLDLGYRRALERVRSLYAPDPADPYPRHHQHYGASLAVRADVYRRAGGMPAVRTSEDVALVRAVEAVGGRVRHSDRVRATTSARRVGRAEGGLADAFTYWSECVDAGRPVTVESSADADARLGRLGLWRQAHAGPAPAALVETPAGGQEITAAIAGLRAIADRLVRLSLAERLDAAARHANMPALRAA